ncbi:alpha/beta hydrolase-fold protein [Pseudoalteromonas piscicida]|uniref:alpha/beta hydrolase-fold protein n=1 Tax=Pseudoalteromonas piscicida TaxID=43662 RepID=UPI0027383D83|nr:alpha/beta hydrolase-fold protein [Pseudoalteromonas piscicida]MDP4486497.1 alpha/beta hydrolase-fold protein [Pseudoalteromonas piscicida]
MRIGKAVQCLFAVTLAALFSGSAIAESEEKIKQEYEQQTKTLMSKVLDEKRTFTIQLPKNYHTNSNKKYPVIYRLDGKGNLPLMTAVLERLQGANVSAAPEVIIVAIENTDRLRDLYPTKNKEPAGPMDIGGGAPKFLEFIETELIPYVNQTYRTHDFKVIAGASAAGTFALYALQAKPELFQAHIAYSPAIWWNFGATAKSTKAFISKTKRLDNFLYITIGEEGGVMRERYDDMARFLEENQPHDLRFFSEAYDNVPHGLVSAAGIFSAYQKLFLPTQMPARAYTGELSSITKYYQQLSAQYGEVFEPQEAVIRELGYYYVSMGNVEEAIKLFKFGVSRYPNNADAYNGLAYGYETDKQYQASLEQVNKALALSSKGDGGYDVFVARKERLTKLLGE